MGGGASSRKYRAIERDLATERRKVSSLEEKLDEVERELVKARDELRRKNAEGEIPGPPTMLNSGVVNAQDIALPGVSLLDYEAPSDMDRKAPARQSRRMSLASRSSPSLQPPTRNSQRVSVSSNSRRASVAIEGYATWRPSTANSDVSIGSRSSTVGSRPSTVGRQRRSVAGFMPPPPKCGFGGDEGFPTPLGGEVMLEELAQLGYDDDDGGLPFKKPSDVDVSPANYKLPEADPTLLARRRVPDARAIAHLTSASKEADLEESRRQSIVSNPDSDEIAVSSYTHARRDSLSQEYKAELLSRPHKCNLPSMPTIRGDRGCWPYDSG